MGCEGNFNTGLSKQLVNSSHNELRINSCDSDAGQYISGCIYFKMFATPDITEIPLNIV